MIFPINFTNIGKSENLNKIEIQTSIMQVCQSNTAYVINL